MARACSSEHGRPDQMRSPRTSIAPKPNWDTSMPVRPRIRVGRDIKIYSLSGKMMRQVLVGFGDAGLFFLQRAPITGIFQLNADTAGVPGLVERVGHLAPVNGAIAGNAIAPGAAREPRRRLQRRREMAIEILGFGQQGSVLAMAVINPIFELLQ